MNTSTPTLAARTLRPVFHLAVSALAVAVLTACGGGGDVATSDSGVQSGNTVTKSVATGVVTGYGSIIANGVRYEMSDSKVVDDNGVETTCAADDNCGLKLGVEVEIEAGAVSRSSDSSVTPSSKATRVHYGSSLLGPVTVVGEDQWVVLGQKVNLTTPTVIEGTAVANTSIVEVHGLLDKVTGEITATRIEVKSSAPAVYRLRGRVTQKGVDGVDTVRIGDQVVSFANVPAAFAALSNDQFIRVKLSTTPNAAGQWVALSIKSNERRLGSDDNGAHSELEGLVESVALTDGVVTSFVVNGSTVTLPATGVTYEHGTAAALVVGARLEAEGIVTNGALVASKIEFKRAKKRSERGSDDRSGDDNGSDDSRSSFEYEFHGAVTNLTSTTFVLRGVTFDFSNASAVSFPKGGSLADLAAWAAGNRRVEAKGYLMADGVTVQLVRIKLDN